MEAYDIVELMELHAKATNKWCMYLHINIENKTSLETEDKINKTMPYLKNFYPHPLTIPTKIVLTFDTEKEMEECFNLTTEDNNTVKYNIYALTCSNTGELLNENT